MRKSQLKLGLTLLLFSSLQSPWARATGLERRLYCSQNLWVDENLNKLDTLFGRAAKTGYTHVLLSDPSSQNNSNINHRPFARRLGGLLLLAK